MAPLAELMLGCHTCAGGGAAQAPGVGHGRVWGPGKAGRRSRAAAPFHLPKTGSTARLQGPATDALLGQAVLPASAQAHPLLAHPSPTQRQHPPL